MKEAGKPKPGWNAGSGHRANSLGAEDDGYSIGMLTGSLTGESTRRLLCSASSLMKGHLLPQGTHSL